MVKTDKNHMKKTKQKSKKNSKLQMELGIRFPDSYVRQLLRENIFKNLSEYGKILQSYIAVLELFNPFESHCMGRMA